jgi:hypothetical protein
MHREQMDKVYTGAQSIFYSITDIDRCVLPCALRCIELLSSICRNLAGEMSVVQPVLGAEVPTVLWPLIHQYWAAGCDIDAFFSRLCQHTAMDDMTEVCATATVEISACHAATVCCSYQYQSSHHFICVRHELNGHRFSPDASF